MIYFFKNQYKILSEDEGNEQEENKYWIWYDRETKLEMQNWRELNHSSYSSSMAASASASASASNSYCSFLITFS